jgi:hypothetical protein
MYCRNVVRHSSSLQPRRLYSSYGKVWTYRNCYSPSGGKVCCFSLKLRCHFLVRGVTISSLLGLQAASRRYSSLGESGANFALVLPLAVAASWSKPASKCGGVGWGWYSRTSLCTSVSIQFRSTAISLISYFTQGSPKRYWCKESSYSEQRSVWGEKRQIILNQMSVFETHRTTCFLAPYLL